MQSIYAKQIDSPYVLGDIRYQCSLIQSTKENVHFHCNCLLPRFVSCLPSKDNELFSQIVIAPFAFVLSINRWILFGSAEKCKCASEYFNRPRENVAVDDLMCLKIRLRKIIYCIFIWSVGSIMLPTFNLLLYCDWYRALREVYCRRTQNDTWIYYVKCLFRPVNG